MSPTSNLILHCQSISFNLLESRLSNCRVRLHHTLTLSGQPRQSRIDCVFLQCYYVVSLAAEMVVASSISPLVERGLIPSIKLQDDIQKLEEVQRESLKHLFSMDEPH